jgi:hypothetical protein
METHLKRMKEPEQANTTRVGLSVDVPPEDVWTVFVSGKGETVQTAVPLPLPRIQSSEADILDFTGRFGVERIVSKPEPDYTSWSVDGLKGRREELLMQLKELQLSSVRRRVLDELRRVEKLLQPVWAQEQQGTVIDDEAFAQRFLEAYDEKK